MIGQNRRKQLKQVEQIKSPLFLNFINYTNTSVFFRYFIWAKKNGVKWITCTAALLNKNNLFVVLSLQYFATTIKAIWADVVTQMRFTCSWLDT